jgi:LPS O-antigen subunit length determinant protein (WzzB/FepE family)
MNMVSIDLVHLLVRIWQGESRNIIIFSLVVFVIAYSTKLLRVVSWRGMFFGLVIQLQA